MEDIKYRAATLDDLETLYTFEQGIVQAERPYDVTLKPGKIHYYDLKALVKSDQAEVIVAEAQGELVGSGYVQIKDAKDYLRFDQYGHIGFIYVKPSHRRKGISQNVIGALKSWAQSKDIQELRLEVYDENEKAVAAYRKLGMVKHMVEMRVEI